MAGDNVERPLTALFPAVGKGHPFVDLGVWPTPVEDAAALCDARSAPARDVWIKRDDLSSPVYGGNKVRTLEVLFGQARASGQQRVYASGAYGSNHALATALHAPRAGLEAGALLFPQPYSEAARENLQAVLTLRPRVRWLPHWSFLPWALLSTRQRDRKAAVMVPGGATPVGALGYVSAAFELARQVEQGAMPAPATIVLPVGSTCTTAGLLVGLRAAARLGIGWSRAPRIVAVRVTPWPVTDPWRIAWFARATATLLHRRTGHRVFEAPSLAALRAGVEVDRRFLGRGYGEPTTAGLEAIGRFALLGYTLDTTYSAKAGAALVDRLRAGRDAKPVLFWATKSSAALPPAAPWADPPTSVRRWLRSRDARAKRPNGAPTHRRDASPAA